jgi:hypothetical protein
MNEQGKLNPDSDTCIVTEISDEDRAQAEALWLWRIFGSFKA